MKRKTTDFEKYMKSFLHTRTRAHIRGGGAKRRNAKMSHSLNKKIGRGHGIVASKYTWKRKRKK